MTPELIQAIVAAAEREDRERPENGPGFQALIMPAGRTRWRNCVMQGYLWYNDGMDSTRVVRL